MTAKLIMTTAEIITEFVSIHLVDVVHSKIQLMDLFGFILNEFHATGLFLFALRTSENQNFSDVFGGTGGI